MSEQTIARKCPECGALHDASLGASKVAVDVTCTVCGVTSAIEAWKVGVWHEAEIESTDPDVLGGSIEGPMDEPWARENVLVDTRNAVLIDGTDVATIHAQMGRNGDGRRLAAVVMSGRVNQSHRRARVLFLMGPDGLAAIVSEGLMLAAREGGEFADEFGTLLTERMAQMEGL